MMKTKILGLLMIALCAIIQTNGSPLDAREDDMDGEETDREFEDAFEETFNEEIARGFHEENVDEAREFEEEVRQLQDQPSPYDEREEESAGEETDRELEDAFDQAVKEEMVRDFQEENMDETRTFEDENEMNLEYQQEDDQSENERQISADFDITPPEEDEERQIVETKPRSTKPLRLSNLIIRPVLTKRCQAETQFSHSHCAKYLACGKTMFRGAVRTCESGQLFDAVLKKCRDSSKVDCKIY